MYKKLLVVAMIMVTLLTVVPMARAITLANRMARAILM